MRPQASALMPMPVSSTATVRRRTLPSMVVVARTVTAPFSVNFAAFDTKLVKTWRTRPGSPMTLSGSSGSKANTKSTPFSNIFPASNVAASLSTVLGRKGTCSNSTFPASILLKSRMSLSKSSKLSALELMMSAYSCCSRFSVVRPSRFAMPITPFSGVRISWLITARKDAFASAAPSASLRAFPKRLRSWLTCCANSAISSCPST